MSRNNQDYCNRQEPKLVRMPQLLGKQQQDSKTKNNEGSKSMVMLSVTMPERVGSDNQGEKNHKVFKSHVINEVDTENREG
jgi:hypothetical protein